MIIDNNFDQFKYIINSESSKDSLKYLVTKPIKLLDEKEVVRKKKDLDDKKK